MDFWFQLNGRGRGSAGNFTQLTETLAQLRPTRNGEHS